MPSDLDATLWENVEGLYKALLDRELKDSGCLEQLLLDRSELDAAVYEARVNLSIRMRCHTDDKHAKSSFLAFIEHVMPRFEQAGFELDRKIVGSPHAANLDGARYEVLLRNLRADIEIFREENIALQIEEKKLDQQFQQTSGAMTVAIWGEERTLPEMVRFMEEAERATREAAWRGIWERRELDRERLDDVLDKLVALRSEIARNAGIDNYRDYMFKRLHRFDYTPADCESFHDAVEAVCVPLLRSLNAERASSLGVDPLRPWDLTADVKSRPPLRPFANCSELIDKSSRLFHRMDLSLGKMFDSLRSGDGFDLESRKWKAPGGFHANRERSRRSFIFMNAVGTHRDLDTMLHESGHAFHAMLCHGEPLLHYKRPPKEFTEVASMSMELFAFPYLDEFYDEMALARAKRQRLELVATILPWIAVLDAFQHWLYANPDHNRSERDAYWIQLNDRFGPAVSWEGLERYRQMSWQIVGHLYGAPFYMIEYGIAQLGALQFWLQFKQDRPRAMENYRRGLALGGSRPLPELFQAAELTFEFGHDMMKRLMDEVQKELDKIRDLRIV
ncbi:MAG TPA: M3 family oligoendopeptidase [Pirellulaceae bacterium]|nr:M3 family oligoendopeptidase [Pirellulaceae bacterium]